MKTATGQHLFVAGKYVNGTFFIKVLKEDGTIEELNYKKEITVKQEKTSIMSNQSMLIPVEPMLIEKNRNISLEEEPLDVPDFMKARSRRMRLERLRKEKGNLPYIVLKLTSSF